MKVDDSKYHMQVENRKDWNKPKRYVWSMNWHTMMLSSIFQLLSFSILRRERFWSSIKISRNTVSRQVSQQNWWKRKQKAKGRSIYQQNPLPGKLEETELAYEDNSYRPMGTPFRSGIVWYVRPIDLASNLKGNYINVGSTAPPEKYKSFYYRWDDIGDLPKLRRDQTSEEATRIPSKPMNMDLILSAHSMKQSLITI